MFLEESVAYKCIYGYLWYNDSMLQQRQKITYYNELIDWIKKKILLIMVYIFRCV
jgi:hypothetical protein